MTSRPFFERLHKHYADLARKIKSDADSQAALANTSDLGFNRENVYRELLQDNLPSTCEVFLGGFLFDQAGLESQQIDIIVTESRAPRFNLRKDGISKAFASVDGCLAVVSVKSNLTKNEIIDALSNVASIPNQQDLRSDQIQPNYELEAEYYKGWPLKVVFGFNGNKVETLKQHVDNFYSENPKIPYERRPDYIHTANEGLLVKSDGKVSLTDIHGNETTIAKGEYVSTSNFPDVLAFVNIFEDIHRIAISASHILYFYRYIREAVEAHSTELLKEALLSNK
ncbi:MAG: DUF6602 domain-containing protein [Pseudomonadota bacterium]